MDAEQARTRLMTRRQELMAELSGGEDGSAAVELDQTRQGRLSRMDALQGQAMGQAAQRRRRQELARIDRALARLAEDDYGGCLECGAAIAPGRLAIDPAAELCVACAEQQEQG